MTTKAPISAKEWKWQAGPGVLFCVEEKFDLNETSIILPGTQKEVSTVARIISVGPNVIGYEEGQVIAYQRAAKMPGGLFIKIEDVWGRLVPKGAPNSAVGVTSDGKPVVQENGAG